MGQPLCPSTFVISLTCAVYSSLLLKIGDPGAQEVYHEASSTDPGFLCVSQLSNTLRPQSGTRSITTEQAKPFYANTREMLAKILIEKILTKIF